MLQIHEDKVPIRIDENGTLRVGTTRVALSTVISCFENGSTPEDIVDAFEALSLADVYSVVGYYLKHEKEIKAQLEHERVEGESLRKEIEAEFSPNPVRERLLQIKRKRQTSSSQ